MASMTLPSLSSVAASSGSGLNLGSALMAARRNPAACALRVRSYKEVKHVRSFLDLAEPQLNATPLIDVMLVLLVMLIITLPVATHAVKLNLPQGPATAPQPAIRLDIVSDGAIYWNGTARGVARAAQPAFRGGGAAARIAPRVNVVPEKRARYERRGAGAGRWRSARRSTRLSVAPVPDSSGRSESALGAHRRLGDPAEQQNAEREPVPERRLPSRSRCRPARLAGFAGSSFMKSSGTALTAATSAWPFRGDAGRRNARAPGARRNRCCACRRARGSGASAHPAGRELLAGICPVACCWLSLMAASSVLSLSDISRRAAGRPVTP